MRWPPCAWGKRFLALRLFCTGLFIDFELTSLSVNGNPAQPTLTADFGDIPPQESVVAVWFLTSSLQGFFTNFEATFSFVNPLGIPEAGLDIIDSLEVFGKVSDAPQVVLGTVFYCESEFVSNPSRFSEPREPCESTRIRALTTVFRTFWSTTKSTACCFRKPYTRL